MDGAIILTWSLSMIVFSVLQSIGLRRVDRRTSSVWQRKIAIIFLCLPAFLFICLMLTFSYPLSSVLFGGGMIMILISGTVLLYLLSFYSYVESSITVKLLTLIGLHQPLSHYGKKIIVVRRLERLVAIGQIRQIGALYAYSDVVTAFSLRHGVSRLITFFFPWRKR